MKWLALFKSIYPVLAKYDVECIVVIVLLVVSLLYKLIKFLVEYFGNQKKPAAPVSVKEDLKSPNNEVLAVISDPSQTVLTPKTSIRTTIPEINVTEWSLAAGTMLYGNVYQIESILGQGIFGITYLAKAKVKMSGSLGTLDTVVPIAIKEFFMKELNGRSHSSVVTGSQGGLYEEYKSKFEHEARNLSKLKHPHIVKVLELFEENNTFYYSMEYCSGGSLEELINKENGLSEQRALDIFRQIASALSYMHDHRMLHLDLKPSNIMFREHGEAVLIDFGLSKQYLDSGEPESSTRIGLGTPGYAPLEQMNCSESKEFLVTTDIYALGATMFKMLTNRRPPEASVLLNEGFPDTELRRMGIRDSVISCLSKAMSPLKKDRYQKVEDFVCDLEQAVLMTTGE